MNCHVVVVDDDPDALQVLGKKLARIGFDRIHLEQSSVKVARQVVDGATFDLALINMTMPEIDGTTLLDTIKANSPSTECIMVTSVNEARVAVECLSKGAYDYLVKPVSFEDLHLSVKRTLERKRLLDLLELEKRDDLPALDNELPFTPIVTRSKKMRRILKEAELHAASPAPLLITGESGTGKSLLARAIHRAGPRAQFLFIPVDVASLTDAISETALFDPVTAAVDGADAPRGGMLEFARRGTLFLDQIGDLPLRLQETLLQRLKEGAFSESGSDGLRPANLRLITTTSDNLERMVARKRFRKDLYYRVRGGWLHLPPLRERRGDIPLLTRRFLEKYYATDAADAIDAAAQEILNHYPFPGNVRELKAVLGAAADRAGGAPILTHHLPAHVLAAQNACTDANATARPLAEVERGHIVTVYKQTGENKSRTARLLGIGLNTLRRKLAAYNLR